MFNRRFQLRFCIYAGLIILSLLIPILVTNSYWLYMLTVSMIYIMLVASCDLQYGYTGLITLAHGTFFGIGAYSCSILQLNLEMPFWPSLFIAIFIVGAIAFLIGIPLLRTTGPYFALGSLAVAAVIHLVILNWSSLTGGYSLFGIPKPESWNILGWVIDFDSKTTYYYLIWAFMVFTIFVVLRLANSRVGRALIAIRQNNELAQGIGVNLWGYKLFSFVISSCLAAIAGGLYASYLGAIQPAIAGFGMGFTILAMAIVGGSTTISGYIAGTVLMWLVPEFLEFTVVYRPLLYGLLLVLVIIFMPFGIMGSIKRMHPVMSKWIK